MASDRAQHVRAGRSPRESLAAVLPLIVVVGASILVQAVLYWQYVDNQVVNDFSPTSNDAEDYFARASAWRAEGFGEAFGDAYRTPGYPAFIAVCQIVFGANAALGARILQIIATAIACGLLFLTARKLVGLGFAMVVGLAAALYVPVSYFSPILYAETLTVLGVAVMLFLLSRSRSGSWWPWVAVGVTLACLTYLKPNNILMIIPAVVFALADGAPRKWVRSLAVVVVCGLLLAPWAVFASVSQGRVVALSTTSGLNLYLGLGIGGNSSEGPLNSIGRTLGVDREPDPPIPKPEDQLSASEKNSYWTSAAGRVWQDRPASQAGYAGAKALYALGLLPNGLKDAVLGLVAVVSAVGALVLIRQRDLRQWGLALGAVFLVVALQAAAFLPNQRFRVALLDAPAILVIGLALGVLWRRRQAGGRRSEG